MIRFYLLLLLFIPLSCVSSFANEGTVSSYEGRHFLVGFLDNEIDLYSPPYQTIYISSKYNTEVTITEPRIGATYTLVLRKDTIIEIDVDQDYEHKNPEVIHGNKLIEISSKHPISCVAKSSMYLSSEKFSIIPTRNWGKEHYAISMPNDYYLEALDQNPNIIEAQKTSRLGEFLVLANENYTNVEITVAAATFRGAIKDSTIKVRLNKGESYLIKSKYSHGVNGVHDLSGSRIVSDKPVGLVSGHMRTSIQQQTVDNIIDTKDHIVEMLPPTNTW
ncbi:MAG: IgGFc-binding protein, partial [Candidatus Kapaibacterium sp.]